MPQVRSEPLHHTTESIFSLRNGLLSERLAALAVQIADLQLLRGSVAQLQHDATAGDPTPARPDQICRYL